MKNIFNIFKVLWQPLLLIIMHEHSNAGDVRRMHWRPAYAIVITIVLLTVGAVLPFLWLDTRDLEIEIARQGIEREHNLRQQLMLQVSQAETEVEISRAKLAAMQNTVDKLSNDKHDLQEQVRAFESLWQNKRHKNNNIRAISSWLDGGRISYSIAIFRDKKAKRDSNTNLRIIALENDKTKARRQTLRLSGDAHALSYHANEHTLLRGNVLWREDWQATILRIERQDANDTTNKKWREAVTIKIGE
ncbi:MAG: hypothetical protein R8K21_09155 [Mariprofundales bacterium]